MKWYERANELKDEAAELQKVRLGKLHRVSELLLENREQCEHFIFVAERNYPGCKQTDYFCQSANCPLLGETGRYVKVVTA